MRGLNQNRIQCIARVLLYGLFFAIPFSKAAIEVLFPLLFVLWLAGWCPPSKGLLFFTESRWGQLTFLSLMAYLGICAWSVSFSDYPGLSLRGLVRKTLEYVFLFLIVSDVANHPRAGNRCVRSLWSAAWLVGGYAVLQEILNRDPFRGRPLDYSRMIGPYENPNDLATYLMVVLLILLALLLSRPWRVCKELWLLGGLLLGCLIATLSFGAFIGFGAGLLFLLLALREKRPWVWVGIVTGFLGLFLLPSFRIQLLQVFTLSDVASQERLIMWKTAWRMIQDNPLQGLGLNTFMAHYSAYAPVAGGWPAYAHNCFLQIAAETGWLGLSLFFGFLLCLLVFYWNALSTEPSAGEGRILLAGIGAGIAAFLVQSLFDTNLYALRQATLFWALSGLTAGLSAQLLHTEERSEAPTSVPSPFEQVAAG
jgi:O-antigen ligase